MTRWSLRLAPGAAPKTPLQRPPKAKGYRLDLDGLRGFAIALVVVFHVWFGRVSGGVDVFLVLSGFFFTGLLLRRAESAEGVGVVHTARRTARRLLPAMVVVLAAVVVATVLLRPYTQWPDIAAQTLASLLYYQNWHLALSWSDYLAADPSVSPLQHLWSMSIQGQFYLAVLLLVALVAWCCRRWGSPTALRPVLAVTLTVLTVASFAYAEHGVATHQGWNYYDSFARTWELLVGGLIALAAPWISLPRAVRAVLAALGFVAIAACGWLIDGANAFPGPAALLPVGAAVALILAGNNVDADAHPMPNRLLATAPMVRLGELAYALYLWHWPILIFYLGERRTPTAGFVGGSAIILLALALAYLTNRFVEERLRLRPKALETGGPAATSTRRTGVVVLALGTVVLTAAFSAHIVTRVYPPQPVGYLNPAVYPGAEALVRGVSGPHAPMRPSLWEAPADAAYPTRDGCIADWDTRDVITCGYGDSSAERTIAVVGSSHAEHWVPALDVLAREHHFRIATYLKMGCPLTVAAEPTYKGEAIPDCRDWSAEVIDRLGAERPDWVFTTGTRPRDDTGDETPTDYLDVWTQLSKRHLNVIAIRDTPWLRRDGVRYRGTDCLAQRGDRISCGMPRAAALDQTNPETEAAASFSNVFPVDLTNAVCEPQVCPITEGNILIYHDEHHLTASYSRSLAPELGRQLQSILGWW
ncbi:acyltransferase family protein [Nocardia altamirensis]|uniref:acyltransferase family protein n=1 Tax=Nocardia altamirensis TaxID=472158 RepID=UPI0009FD94BC|nr:acyltransferase family protein [Nocardia altamirensis]